MFWFQVVDKKHNISDIPEWFQGSRLSYAENLLQGADDKTAIYFVGKSIFFIICQQKQCQYNGNHNCQVFCRCLPQKPGRVVVPFSVQKMFQMLWFKQSWKWVTKFVISCELGETTLDLTTCFVSNIFSASFILAISFIDQEI